MGRKTALAGGIVVGVALFLVIGYVLSNPWRTEDDWTESSSTDSGALVAGSSQTFSNSLHPQGSPHPPPPNQKIISEALATTVAALGGNTPTTPEDRKRLTEILMDPDQSLKARRQAVFQLARVDNLETVRLLDRARTNAPPYLKAAIAESLGAMSSPAAGSIIQEMLQDQDVTVVRGAIRGVAAQGDLAAVDLLENLLRDPSQSEGVRTEAALALGSVGDPNAWRALAMAVGEMENETIQIHALQGLGQRPLVETQDFFRSLLENPSTSVTMQTEVLGALAETPDNPHHFLAEYLNHAEPDIRAAAALAMSQAMQEGDVGGALMERLGVEQDPAVRLRLYQALGNQQAVDLELGLALLETESMGNVKLEGYRNIATALRREQSETLIGQFDQQGVPFLKNTALGNENLHHQLTSVMALSRAKTGMSITALEEIRLQASHPEVQKAASLALKNSGVP